MCSAKGWMQSPSPSHCNLQHKSQPSRRHGVRVHRVIIRRRYEEGKIGAEKKMELKNLKLYLENRSIIEENEKLRQKALQLMLENQALLSQYHKNFQLTK